MKKINNKEFFTTDTITLAQQLIGKWIVVKNNDQEIKAQITETEAYLGIQDSACHTFGGKRTNRTEAMWNDGGTIYVYLCYGLHYMLNIVSSDHQTPEAVLIRACKKANGPAKLTKYLGITKEYNNQSIINNPQITLCDDGSTYSFTSDKRIGIDYAQEKDRNALLRFILNDN